MWNAGHPQQQPGPCSSMSTPSAPKTPRSRGWSLPPDVPLLGPNPRMSGPCGCCSNPPLCSRTFCGSCHRVSQNLSPRMEPQHTAGWGLGPSTPHISNGAPCMGTSEPPGRPVCTPKSTEPLGASPWTAAALVWPFTAGAEQGQLPGLDPQLAPARTRSVWAHRIIHGLRNAGRGG